MNFRLNYERVLAETRPVKLAQPRSIPAGDLRPDRPRQRLRPLHAGRRAAPARRRRGSPGARAPAAPAGDLVVLARPARRLRASTPSAVALRRRPRDASRAVRRLAVARAAGSAAGRTTTRTASRRWRIFERRAGAARSRPAISAIWCPVRAISAAISAPCSKPFWRRRVERHRLAAQRLHAGGEVGDALAEEQVEEARHQRLPIRRAQRHGRRARPRKREP